ncbi:MAG: hypothetical protein HY401_05160 [Elusimicrobia bacterium]|nr:hypothetical protein [Elusimicrobiota bacterium]
MNWFFLQQVKERRFKRARLFWLVFFGVGTGVAAINITQRFMGAKRDSQEGTLANAMAGARKEMMPKEMAPGAISGAMSEEPVELTYDSSFKLFGREKDSKKNFNEIASSPEAPRNDNAKAASPLDWVGRQSKPVITGGLAATLEDMGVKNTLQKFPSLEEKLKNAGAFNSSGRVESPLLARADPDLRRKKPITEEEGRTAYAIRRRTSGLVSFSVDSLQRILSWVPIKPLPQLRLAAVITKYALVTDDPDSASLLGRAYVTGENPRGALEGMRQRGEIGNLQRIDPFAGMAGRVVTVPRTIIDSTRTGGIASASFVGGGRTNANSPLAPATSNNNAGEPSSEPESQSQPPATNSVCEICQTTSQPPGPVIQPEPEPGPVVDNIGEVFTGGGGGDSGDAMLPR